MTNKEIKKVTIKMLHIMHSALNSYSVRDTLCQLTELDFWEKESLTSLDKDTSRQVIRAALDAIENGSERLINDIYDIIYHFEI